MERPDKKELPEKFEPKEFDEILSLKVDEIDHSRWKVLDALEVQDLLREIPKGKDGLDRLINTSEVRGLDQRVEQQQNAGAPVGEPLGKSIKQISVSERTAIYKTDIQKEYDIVVDNTRVLYHRLAKGDSISYAHISGVVNSIHDTFLTDKNILLNLSSLQSSTRDYLFNHAVNVCLLALNISTASRYSLQQVHEIGIAGLLSDIGMMTIDSEIRYRNGSLSRDDVYEIQKHPIWGYHILSRLPQVPEVVALTSYQHHERMNGTGYPKGRKGHLIHHYARIIGIADSYEAMISKRAYRKRNKPYKAMENILKLANKGFLDAIHVRSFLKYMSLFPVGSLVRLKSGKIGKVVHANFTEFTKPLVSVLTTNTGEPLANDQIYQLDLMNNTGDSIIEALDYSDENEADLMRGF